MSEHEASDKSPQIRYESGIPIIDAHLNEMQRKQTETERQNQEYKDKQILLNKLLVAVSALLVVSTIVTGVFQLWYTHRQWKLTSDGLSKMGDQIWAAKDAAYASKAASGSAAQALKDSESSSQDTLGQMKAQAGAQQKAANAAIGSIQITKASLRARIVLTPKPLDIQHKLLNISIGNVGKIPSGGIEVTAHQATFWVLVPYGPIDFKNVIDQSWKRSHFPPSSISDQWNLGVPIPKAVESNLTAGTEAIMVAGTVIYNHGFTEDGNDTDTFCIKTTYHTVAKELFLSPCDPGQVTPALEKIDGYPDNEEHD